MGFPDRPRHGGHEHAHARDRLQTHLAHSECSEHSQELEHDGRRRHSDRAETDTLTCRRSPSSHDTRASDSSRTGSDFIPACADSFHLIQSSATFPRRRRRPSVSTHHSHRHPSLPPRRRRKQHNRCDGLSPFSPPLRFPCPSERAAQVQAEPGAKRSG